MQFFSFDSGDGMCVTVGHVLAEITLPCSSVVLAIQGQDEITSIIPASNIISTTPYTGEANFAEAEEELAIVNVNVNEVLRNIQMAADSAGWGELCDGWQDNLEVEAVEAMIQTIAMGLSDADTMPTPEAMHSRLYDSLWANLANAVGPQAAN